ncbi:MAG TPA: hypothetical protein VII90_07425, partial [Anaerolineales bacterium]
SAGKGGGRIRLAGSAGDTVKSALSFKLFGFWKAPLIFFDTLTVEFEYSLWYKLPVGIGFLLGWKRKWIIWIR